ncbi:hypothetical protein OE88DRAFT_399172 [Heliocybe sulcata]|uniref:Uncharacterized protein n=1 Tax=Heliocybe sulcata TaxID=5364 RepID=A0A5C3N659_9AGAM|nr:hypothetical protein OE88DRAFT_399172 [Heliocybe sulcata]
MQKRTPKRTQLSSMSVMLPGGDAEATQRGDVTLLRQAASMSDRGCTARRARLGTRRLAYRNTTIQPSGRRLLFGFHPSGSPHCMDIKEAAVRISLLEQFLPPEPKDMSCCTGITPTKHDRPKLYASY